MDVFIVVMNSPVYEDWEILDVFSTHEKAVEYMKDISKEGNDEEWVFILNEHSKKAMCRSKKLIARIWIEVKTLK